MVAKYRIFCYNAIVLMGQGQTEATRQEREQEQWHTE